jgi:hypothetical protein
MLGIVTALVNPFQVRIGRERMRGITRRSNPRATPASPQEVYDALDPGRSNTHAIQYVMYISGMSLWYTKLATQIVTSCSALHFKWRLLMETFGL